MGGPGTVISTYICPAFAYRERDRDSQGFAASDYAILPYVEDGTVILVGATTENPSFEVNAALVFVP